jgi:hypothetical protein
MWLVGRVIWICWIKAEIIEKDKWRNHFLWANGEKVDLEFRHMQVVSAIHERYLPFKHITIGFV